MRKTSEKKDEAPAETPSCSLPPYDPLKPIGEAAGVTSVSAERAGGSNLSCACVRTGLDLLVPKTGFFCKACKRFFCGGKPAEINHCKTLKHYENLQVHTHTHREQSCGRRYDSFSTRRKRLRIIRPLTLEHSVTNQCLFLLFFFSEAQCQFQSKLLPLLQKYLQTSTTEGN